jgi:hypothetical protein
MLCNFSFNFIETIGFEWWPNENDAKWNKHFNELKQFWHDHGHCNVSDGDPKNKALGRWVAKQRRYYKNTFMGNKKTKDGCITQQRIKKLESIGFQWKLHTQQASCPDTLYDNGNDEVENEEDQDNRKPPATEPRNQTTLSRDVRPNTQREAQSTADVVGANRQKGEEEISPEERARRKKNALALLDKIDVGTRLAVFWPLDDEYYSSTVMTLGSIPTKLFLRYHDDDYREWIDLTEHDFKLLPVAGGSES